MEINGSIFVLNLKSAFTKIKIFALFKEKNVSHPAINLSSTVKIEKVKVNQFL